MRIRLIPEILAECAACVTPEKMILVLQKNQSPALRALFEYVFYPNLQFSITELPKFKPDPNPMGLSPASLYDEIRRLYVLLDAQKIPLKKKQDILLFLCETLHPSEVELVGKILKRDLGIPLLTYNLVKQAFPKLLP